MDNCLVSKKCPVHHVPETMHKRMKNKYKQKSAEEKRTTDA
jgi:hypothetical protein